MVVCVFFFFFKQKTAYEMRISDWSSDVCSSDLGDPVARIVRIGDEADRLADRVVHLGRVDADMGVGHAEPVVRQLGPQDAEAADDIPVARALDRADRKSVV